MVLFDLFIAVITICVCAIMIAATTLALSYFIKKTIRVWKGSRWD